MVAVLVDHRCHHHPAGGICRRSGAKAAGKELPRSGTAWRIEAETRRAGEARRPKREGCPNGFGLPVHHRWQSRTSPLDCGVDPSRSYGCVQIGLGCRELEVRGTSLCDVARPLPDNGMANYCTISARSLPPSALSKLGAVAPRRAAEPPTWQGGKPPLHPPLPPRRQVRAAAPRHLRGGAAPRPPAFLRP